MKRAGIDGIYVGGSATPEIAERPSIISRSFSPCAT
jgi:hypothetical protein